jgi:hypothetical protein
MGSSYVTIKAVSAPNNSQSTLSHLNIPSNTIVRTVQYVTTQAQQGSTATVTTKSPTAVMQKPTLIAKTNASGKPTILSNIVLTPNIRTSAPATASSGTASYVISSPNSTNSRIVQRVVVSSGQNINIPTLSTRTAQPTIIQPVQQGTPTKIVQIKTTPTILGVAQNQSAMQNIPPLISTQQPTLLNIQNIQNQARKTVTISQQQPQQQSQAGQQSQKVNQIIMPGGVAMKGKTIIVSNQNQNLNLGQRNVILQSVGPGGNPIYQQIPITSGVLRTIADQSQQKTSNQIPALVPTSNLTQNIPGLVIANSSGQQAQTVPRLITNIAQLQPQQQASNHVQIRPVIAGMQQGGQLTLIQRPGQQAQLAQIVQPQTIQKIITRPQQVVVQQTQAAQNPQASGAGTTIKVATSGATTGGQRRGLSLSVSWKCFSGGLMISLRFLCSRSTSQSPARCSRKRIASPGWTRL